MAPTVLPQVIITVDAAAKVTFTMVPAAGVWKWMGFERTIVEITNEAKAAGAALSRSFTSQIGHPRADKLLAIRPNPR